MCLYFVLFLFNYLKEKFFSYLLSATWLHLLNPAQRDAISNKVYRSLTDTTGKIVQANNPLRVTTDDPSSLDMIARMMPSLSTRQIINAVGDKIVQFIILSSFS